MGVLSYFGPNFRAPSVRAGLLAASCESRRIFRRRRQGMSLHFTRCLQQSDITCLLLPLALNLVRSRIPHLLPHPALLAHTIYQTIQFDTAVRNGGFDLPSTWVGRQAERVQQGSVADWNGLTDVVLAEPGWFESWLAGEKRCVFEAVDRMIS